MENKEYKRFTLFGKAVKISNSLWHSLLKSLKVRDLLTMNMFDNHGADTDVVEGKTVIKNGKEYEYRRSTKNPNVRRLFAADEPESAADPKEGAKYSAKDIHTPNLFQQQPKVIAPTPAQEKQLGEHTPVNTETVKKAPKKYTLFGHNASLFDNAYSQQPPVESGQDKEKPVIDKKEPIPAPKEEQAKTEDKQPETAADDLFSQPKIEPKTDKTANNPIMAFGAEAIDKNIVKRRQEINAKALELLDTKQPDEMTMDDKIVLAQYSGRGGLGGTTYDEISLNEYYTRTQEAQFIWDMLRKFGFKGGAVLEPSCGIGVFLHTAPPDTIVDGVEFDKTSSRIASIIHGNNHNITNQSFEQHIKNSDGGQYAAIVGNPPFGKRGATVIDDPEKIDINTAEQYFLDRSLDELEEGGLLGMIVPTGIMDNKTNQWRLELNKKADFLGAIRMPTGAFKHAKAQVTTDIVFFRKRPDEIREELENIPKEKLAGLYDAQVLDAEFISGTYFEKHPQYAIGEKKKGQWEGQSIWTGDVSRAQLDEIGQLLKHGEEDYSKLDIPVTMPDKPDPRVGDTKSFNGRTYKLNENHRWERVNEAEYAKEELSKDIQEKLGVKTKAEFQELQNDVSRKLELTRDQLGLLDINGLGKELDAYNDKNTFRGEMLKRAALLGLEAKKFRTDLQLGNISGSDAQKEAAKLAGILQQFIETYGHPINDLKLGRYLGKTPGNPILALAGSFTNDGELSALFDDPLAFFSVYHSNYEVGEVDSKNLPQILQYLVDNGLSTSLETIRSMYDGTVEENDLLRDDSVFIDENGGYSPINEVCVGTVYDKLDAWTKLKSDTDSKLSGELSDDDRETFLLKSKKLEDQIFELKRRAGSTDLQNLPVVFSDAGTFFDIKHLNEYVHQKLGGHFTDEIIKNEKTGLFGFKDDNLNGTYLVYASKGAKDPDKAEQAEMKRVMGIYFGEKELNPVMFTFLNFLNGIPMRGDKASELRKEFSEYSEGFVKFLDALDQSPEITEAYNRAYNDWIQKKYDSSIIEGLPLFDYDKVVATDKDGKEFKVRDKIGSHVWEVVRRMYDQGKGIIAHNVGLGKTVSALSLIALSKSTGRCEKPVVIMPKSLQLNWLNEINKWCKDAKVLAVGLKQDSKGNWKEASQQETILQLQRIENEKFDYILITRDDFSRIDFNPETKKRMINELTDKYYPMDADMTKLAKQKRESSIQSLAKKMQNDNAFENIYLENLGIDMMVRDECHDAKNLLEAVNTKIKGIPSAASARSMHNFFASKIIRGANGEKGIFSLTATPISNSPLEVFNMMLPVMEKELSNLGLNTMDQFVERFADHDLRMTADADGTVGEQDMFSGWKAPGALRKMFFRFTDYKTKDDVESVKANIKFPKERASNMLSDLNEGQIILMNNCRARLNTLKYRSKNNDGWSLDTGGLEKAVEEDLLTEEEAKETVNYFYNQFMPAYQMHNSDRRPEDKVIDDCFFSIQSDLIKISSDLDWYKNSSSIFSKTIDDSFVEKHNNLPKYAQLTEHAASIYNSGKKQLIFAINTNLHPVILDNLVKAGIKRSEIAIVNGKTAKDAASRSKFSEGFNSGKYKVIIGNYATMGEGLNFNKECAAITHVQPAWNYAQIEQGNGRGIRQGNDLDFVDTYYMLTKGSIDTFMNDKIRKKGDMVNKFLRGDIDEWSEDVQLDGDEMLAEMAHNPERARKILERRNVAVQEAQKEKNRNSGYKKFDRLFELKSKMNKIEDKESRQFKMFEQEADEIKTKLNQDPDFKLKDFITSGQKPIVIPEHNTAIPVGSVIKFSTHPDKLNEFAVVNSYTPSTGRVQITTYSGDAREVKSIPVDLFIPQYGKTIKTTDFDTAQMFKTLVDKEKLVNMSVINAMPIDALNANRSQILTNIKAAGQTPLMYRNMDGEIKFDSTWYAFKDIELNGGKVLFPQEYPDWVKAAKQDIAVQQYGGAYSFARSVYGASEDVQKELSKAVKNLTKSGTETEPKIEIKAPQDKFEIPNIFTKAYAQKIQELSDARHLKIDEWAMAIDANKKKKDPANLLHILQNGLKKEYISHYNNSKNKEDFLARSEDRRQAIYDLHHINTEMGKWYNELDRNK